MAAPLSSSAISASPSNSITAATSSRSGLVAASRRRKTAAATDGSPRTRCNEATAAAASSRPPTLREPELGERPARERVWRREHAPRHRDRIGQKCLGGTPVTVLEKDPAVVGAALRIQKRAPVPVDEAFQRLHPLRRAL